MGNSNEHKIDKRQKEILAAMIDFVEENWVAFNSRFEERTGHSIDEGMFESLNAL